MRKQRLTTSLFAMLSLSEADRKRLHDDAFANDFYTEFACLLMELEELSETVYATFLDAKREKKTLVEATVLSKVAIDSAASVIASFQLRYPDNVQNATELLILIEDRLSLEQIAHLVQTVQAAWMPSKDPTEIRYQYVPGTVLLDFVDIMRVFVSMTSLMPARFKSRGGQYDEATTPDFVIPVWGHPADFFMHYLPILLHACGDMHELKVTQAPDDLETWFLTLHEILRTGKISIHLVFVCIVWIRSVAALQGNRGLAHTTSLSLMHIWKLEQRLDASMATNGTHGFFYENTKVVREVFQELDYFSAHMRVNPLRAGCIMLDHHIRYLTLGNDSQCLMLFRPFCHIYSALLEHQLIAEIPFIEDCLKVYEATVFTQSRAAVTKGSFAKSFLRSNKMVTASLVYRHNKGTPSKPGHAKSVLEKGRITYLSRVVRLLKDNDFLVLPSASSVSWTALLSALSSLCQDELFGSRLLSRDALKLSDDLKDVFFTLCDTLGRRPQHVKMIARSIPDFQALQNSVFSLLSIMDSLTAAQIARSDGIPVEMCRRAAAVVANKFGVIARIEQSYFTFPETPAWISIEFPYCSEKSPVPSTEAEFNTLMVMLKTSRGRLHVQGLDDFKRRVVASPAVLAMITPEEELWSLLHHAAAGPAHDLLLTEWLLQMGALENELAHCRRPDIQAEVTMSTGMSVKDLPNALAVHCAAKKGYKANAKMILEAGYFRDINTRTFHTKKSLMQIAIGMITTSWLRGSCSMVPSARARRQPASKYGSLRQIVN